MDRVVIGLPAAIHACLRSQSRTCSVRIVIEVRSGCREVPAIMRHKLLGPEVEAAIAEQKFKSLGAGSPSRDFSHWNGRHFAGGFRDGSPAPSCLCREHQGTAPDRLRGFRTLTRLLEVHATVHHRQANIEIPSDEMILRGFRCAKKTSSILRAVVMLID